MSSASSSSKTTSTRSPRGVRTCAVFLSKSASTSTPDTALGGADRTLFADTTYTLSGFIKVANGATLTIPVGRFFDTVPGESMRFFPDEVTVHKGDTLKFMGEFHTATLLPTSVDDVAAWAEDNASSPEDPYAFLKSNPDLSTFPLKILGDNPFAPRADCGSTDEPCAYTGDAVVDSGVLFTYADPPPDENSPPTPTGFRRG